MSQEKNVGGVAHQCADDDEVSECAERERANAAGVEAVMLTHDKSTEREEGAATKHLLAGQEEGRRRAFGMARINGAYRPNERGEKQDQHAESGVAVLVRRRAERRPEKNGD